ncbi:hypothetical protein D3C72_1914730 [compost metagenome]
MHHTQLISVEARPQPGPPIAGTPRPPWINQALSGTFSARPPTCSTVTMIGRDNALFSAE